MVTHEEIFATMLPSTLDNSIAARKIFWNVPSVADQVVFYALFVISLIVFGWGLWAHLRLWKAGEPDSSRFSRWPERLALLWNYVFLRRGVNRETQPAIFHSLIFWGFLVLLFTTTMVFIDHDLGWKIYHGYFYLGVTVFSDLFGLGFFIGILLAFHRRYIQKPDLLHNTRSDFLMLLFLVALILQGFGLEGLRIRATNDPWGQYSPVGYAVGLFFWSFSPGALQALHYGLWWFHSITVFTFIALLPYTKFLHLLTSPTNIFFKNIDRPRGALIFPGNVEVLLEQSANEEDTNEFAIGVSNITDLTWKQRLDLDSCTSCGRCQEVCPAYNSGKVLSPKWLILDTRNHLLALHAQGLETGAQHVRRNGNHLRNGIKNSLNALDRWLTKELFLPTTVPAPVDKDDSITGLSRGGALERTRANNPLVEHAAKEIGVCVEASLAGEVMEEDVFWSCTTCGACVEVCPVGIEHVDLIMDVRRSRVLIDGKLPLESRSSLRAIETRGNPFGPAQARFDWAKGLAVPLLHSGDEVDVLYWVGCVSAYDKRKQNIARSMVKILNASGLRWGTLGSGETCSGDPARRLGEENLFQTLAKQNIETLSSIHFHTVVANCPHCFNTLKNEYPQLGNFSPSKEVRVLHHSHFIKEMLDSGKISLQDSIEKRLTFHDPCYLGRYNNTFDAPREILVQIGKKEIAEINPSREKGMCCGAGGGHFWMDMKVGERVNVLRTNQIADTNAEIVATGCPFCMQMLEDGVKLTDREGSLAVQDIAELVAEVMA